MLTHPLGHKCLREEIPFWYVPGEALEALRKALGLRRLLVISLKKAWMEKYSEWRGANPGLEETTGVWEGGVLLPAEVERQEWGTRANK